MSSLPYTETWLVGPQQTNFYTRLYLASPAKAVIVFLHGFAEHVGRYTHFHPKLAERGITVFTFDQRGFGNTGLNVEKRSKGSQYGKTGWTDQMADIDWAITHASKEFPGLPVFLMGQSMGGGETLGFCTQGSKSPYQKTVASLSGAIATSPLILQTTPVLKPLKWVLELIKPLVPNLLFPAAVPAEQLSHDQAVIDAVANDPLIKYTGSLRGLGDMLAKGDELDKTLYKNWPKTLPLLLLHGTEDKVTNHHASQAFHDHVQADTKKIVLYPGAYHELHNETDGLPDKIANEVVSFVEGQIGSSEVPRSNL